MGIAERTIFLNRGPRSNPKNDILLRGEHCPAKD
jgi:hypothetical protein